MEATRLACRRAIGLSVERVHQLIRFRQGLTFERRADLVSREMRKTAKKSLLNLVILSEETNANRCLQAYLISRFGSAKTIEGRSSNQVAE